MTRAHLERVRVRAAAEAEELRRMAQADIDEINAWQEAEAVRLREEAARRIVARGRGAGRLPRPPRRDHRHRGRPDRGRGRELPARARRVLRQADDRVRPRRDRPDGRRAPAAPGPREGRRRGPGPGPGRGRRRGRCASRRATPEREAVSASDRADAAAEALRRAARRPTVHPCRSWPPRTAPERPPTAARVPAQTRRTRPSASFARSRRWRRRGRGAKATNGGNGNGRHASAEVAEKPVPVTTPVDDIASRPSRRPIRSRPPRTDPAARRGAFRSRESQPVDARSAQRSGVSPMGPVGAARRVDSTQPAGHPVAIPGRPGPRGRPSRAGAVVVLGVREPERRLIGRSRGGEVARHRAGSGAPPRRRPGLGRPPRPGGATRGRTPGPDPGRWRASASGRSRSS